MNKRNILYPLAAFFMCSTGLTNLLQAEEKQPSIGVYAKIAAACTIGGCSYYLYRNPQKVRNSLYKTACASVKLGIRGLGHCTSYLLEKSYLILSWPAKRICGSPLCSKNESAKTEKKAPVPNEKLAEQEPAEAPHTNEKSQTDEQLPEQESVMIRENNNDALKRLERSYPYLKYSKLAIKRPTV